MLIYYFTFLFTVLTVWLLTVGVVIKGDNSEDKTCKFWHSLSKNLSNAMTGSTDMVDMNCNSTCSSIECSGHFKQPVSHYYYMSIFFIPN